MTERDFSDLTLDELWEMIANASPVFWTCPNGCRDFVDWNEARTLATCRKCGRASQDGEPTQ